MAGVYYYKIGEWYDCCKVADVYVVKWAADTGNIINHTKQDKRLNTKCKQGEFRFFYSLLLLNCLGF